MGVTSLEVGLKTRTEDLKKLWETLKSGVTIEDNRFVKINNYLAEIPIRMQRREGYEALFALTRAATLLGEIRIEYRDTERRTEDGTDQGDTVECTAEEAPSNVHPLR
jgi:hypothetical protein